MKIKEITFDQGIMVRPYEPCKIAATAILTEEENPAVAMDILKKFVQEELMKVYHKANPDKIPKEKPVEVPNNPIPEKVYTKTEAATPKQNSEEETPNL